MGPAHRTIRPVEGGAHHPPAKARLRTILSGLAAGLFSGLAGVGGGVVLVPALVRLLGLGQHRAHATSLAIIALIASAALIRYGSASQVAWAMVPPLALGGVVGSYIGSRLMVKLPARLLRLLFGLAMLSLATLMLTV